MLLKGSHGILGCCITLVENHCTSVIYLYTCIYINIDIYIVTGWLLSQVSAGCPPVPGITSCFALLPCLDRKKKIRNLLLRWEATHFLTLLITRALVYTSAYPLCAPCLTDVSSVVGMGTRAPEPHMGLSLPTGAHGPSTPMLHSITSHSQPPHQGHFFLAPSQGH